MDGKLSILLTFSLLLFPFLSQGSWYWPFDEGLLEPKSKGMRLSELMEPATTNIDAAADFASDGKYHEAQECYRAAIAELDRIERENPDRAAKPEFATVRNKRAYINAALDAMLLAEARDNAKAVSVTDTTALEMKIVLKPWDEFEEKYVSLTNADDLVAKRVEFLRRSETRALLAQAIADAAKDDPLVAVACRTTQVEMARLEPVLAAARREMRAARREAEAAIARMQRISDAAGKSEGARVFDVGREDARACIAACTKAWPRYGQALSQLNKGAEAIYGVLPPSDEVRQAWGGEEVDVPVEEDDRGLVKNDGDARPEVTSQLDTYMEGERRHTTEVNERAETYEATRRSVAQKIKDLFKKDPKSRKARMLQAGEYLRNGYLEKAKKVVDKLLDEKPNDGPALNMRAAIEAAGGDLEAAEATLEHAMLVCPDDYHARYNMANVLLQKGDVDGARRFYEKGRELGGKRNAEIEKALKEGK